MADGAASGGERRGGPRSGNGRSGWHKPHPAALPHEAVAPDGSPVEVYRRLPGTAEAELLDRALPPECAVLELGCGAGRLTGPLVALGHPVTAVDESPHMLEALRAAVPEAEPIEADIAELLLVQRFGAVILGSHLVNVASPRLRQAFLEACGRHLARTGVALVQTYDPSFDWSAAVGRRWEAGGAAVTVIEAARSGDTVDACVRYEAGGRSWDQRYTAQMLDQRALEAALEQAGLRFERWLDRRQGWLVAVPVHGHSQRRAE